MRQPQVGGQLESIEYHNGTLINDGPINIYLVFYGDWQASFGMNIFKNFIGSLSDSSVSSPSVASWWNISTGYYDSKKRHVSSTVNLAGSVVDAYSLGKHKTVLNNKLMATVIQKHIDDGTFAADRNAIYVILASADITTDDGFCTKYCGYHSSFKAAAGSKDGSSSSSSRSGRGSGSDKKSDALFFAFIGHADACIQSCAYQSALSPNGLPGVDAMVSTLAHELTEAATNPLADAWFSASGEENADLCAWQYGRTHTGKHGIAGSSSSSSYEWNVHGSGGTKYLLQLNMDVHTQACVLQAQGGGGGGDNGNDGPAPAPAPAPSTYGPAPSPGGTLFGPAPSPASEFGPAPSPSLQFGPAPGPGGSLGPSDQAPVPSTFGPAPSQCVPPLCRPIHV